MVAILKNNPHGRRSCVCVCVCLSFFSWCLLQEGADPPVQPPVGGGDSQGAEGHVAGAAVKAGRRTSSVLRTGQAADAGMEMTGGGGEVDERESLFLFLPNR